MHVSQLGFGPICGRVNLAVAVAVCLMGAASASAKDKYSVSEAAFQNALNKPFKGYEGPVFELSHDYPKELPQVDAPWLDVDVDFFSTTKPEWKYYKKYLDTILKYVVRGQSRTLDSDTGWNVKVDGRTQWFHVPWMATDPSTGREFTHGCTNERSASYEDFLGPLPVGSKYTEKKFQSWAFGVYNPVGGYAIGQTFPESGVPQISKDNWRIPKGLPFQPGTLVAKVLFASAKPKDVPFLKHSPKWTVNGHKKQGEDPRALRPVRLVQLDVAVVDPRSPMGWVFGTFAYNGTLAGRDASWWDRMSPVGLQWGSDPWSFPAVPFDDSQPVIQSILAPINIYEHRGAQGRLAGPVDNPQSSCLSCHQGSFAASPVGTTFRVGSGVPQIFDFPGQGTAFTSENTAYFQNTPFPAPYPDPEYLSNISLDTSLQFQVALKSYANYIHPEK